MLGRPRRRRAAPRQAPTREAEPLTSFSYVFVVTYGRSGSTLVQGLLNVLPATTVRGENGMYAVELFHAHRHAITFAEAHANHRPRKVESAFYGAHRMTDERLARHERALMLAVLVHGNTRKQPQRVGFKEVLWHRIPAADTEEFFDWFELVFPGALYVLNTRNMEDAGASGFWRSHDREEARLAISRVVEIQDYLRSSRPERVLDTRYEVITGKDKGASDQALAGLATFVTGGCDDTLLTRMREVLAVGHGPHPFGASRRWADRRDATSHG